MWETAHRSLGTQQLYSSEAQIEMLFWLIDSRGRLFTCKRKQENEPALLLTSDLSKSFPDEFVTETVLLWILWEGFQSEQRFNGSPEDPRRCEAAYLQNMQEVSPKSLERSEPRENLHVGETVHLQLRDAIREDHESPRRGEAVFLLTVRETVHSERQLEGPHEDSHGQEAVSCGMCGKSFRSSSNLPVDTRTTEWRTGKLPGGTPQSGNIKSRMMEKSSVIEMSITQSQSAVRGVMNAPTPCLDWILVWWQKPGQVSWQQLSLWADLVFSALSCSVFHKTTAKK